MFEHNELFLKHKNTEEKLVRLKSIRGLKKYYKLSAI